ncbi:MAG: BON domain-containing protein [Alphaproteobacteria bacterium]|nr:BON domain-containing protein [Alphaproteobacteria bacterium]
MGEYEERYPEAFGRGETTEERPRRRHFFGLNLSRQVRDDKPALAEAGDDKAVTATQPALAPNATPARPPGAAGPGRGADRPAPRRVFVERPAEEIRAEVSERLNQNPYVDLSRIAVTVEAAEVTLAGSVDTLFAVSVARALAANVSGVRRVQAELRVERAPAPPYVTAGAREPQPAA